MGKQVFDKEAVLELIDLSKDTDPTMLDQIIKNFSASGPTLISEIKLGYEENNSEKVEKAAHKLKGSAGMLGLLDLAQKASEVMLAARKSEVVDSQKNVSTLTSIFQNSLAELVSFVTQNRS